MKTIKAIIIIIMAILLGAVSAIAQPSLISGFTGADSTKVSTLSNFIRLAHTDHATADLIIYTNEIRAFNELGATHEGGVGYNVTYAQDSLEMKLKITQRSGTTGGAVDDWRFGWVANLTMTTAGNMGWAVQGIRFNSPANSYYIKIMRVYVAAGVVTYEKQIETNMVINVGDWIALRKVDNDSIEVRVNDIKVLGHTHTTHATNANTPNVKPFILMTRTNTQTAFDSLYVGKFAAGAPPPAPSTRDTVGAAGTIAHFTSTGSLENLVDTSKTVGWQATNITDNFGIKRLRLFVDGVKVDSSAQYGGGVTNIPLYTFSYTAKYSVSSAHTYYMQMLDDSGNVTNTATQGFEVGTALNLINIAYYPDWSIWGMKPWLVDYSAMTHIIHFSADPDPATAPYFSPITKTADSLKLQYGNGNNDRSINFQDSLIIYAHKNGVKALLCIGGIYGTSDASMDAVCSDINKIRQFVSAISNYCKRKGYDGVDVDWEGPNNPTDHANLLNTLRDTLNTWSTPGIITHAVYSFISNGYSTTALQNKVDYVMVMNYDQGTSTYAGFNAPLKPGVCASSGGTWTAWTIADHGPQNWINAGFPKSKIVMGVPFYGWEFTGVDGPCQLRNGGQWYRNYVDVLNYAAQYPNSYRWDDSSKVPYLSFTDGSGVKHMVSYDDSVSIGYKVTYVKNLGIAGVMTYELNAGWLNNAPAGQKDPLLKALKKHLGTMSTPVVQLPGPTLLTPANGATNQDKTNLSIRWNKVIGATRYHVQVSLNSGFTNIVIDNSNVTDTTLAISSGQLNFGTTYYWHVSTGNPSFGAYGTTRSFTTAVQSILVPTTPTLVSPANAATNQSLTPTLRWNNNPATDTVTGYRLQVAADAGFTNIVNTIPAISDTQRVWTQTLSAGVTYYWRVAAENGAVLSSYSTARSFTTQASLPPAPTENQEFYPVTFNPKTGELSFKPPPFLTFGQIGSDAEVKKSVSNTYNYNPMYGGRGSDSVGRPNATAPNVTGTTWPITLNNGNAGADTIDGLATKTDVLKAKEQITAGTNTTVTQSTNLSGQTVYQINASAGPALLDPRTSLYDRESFVFEGDGTGVSGGNTTSNFLGRYTIKAFGTGTSAIVYGTAWAAIDSNSNGMLLLSTDTANTLGSPRGGWVSTLGNISTRQTHSVLPPDGTEIYFRFKTAGTIDSLGFAMGFIKTNNNTPFATQDSTRAGIYLEGGKAGAADSIYGIVATDAGKTKVGLTTNTANTIYNISYKRSGSSILWYVNGTLTKTVTTNLPTAATGGVLFFGVWVYDKTAGKGIYLDEYLMYNPSFNK